MRIPLITFILFISLSAGAQTNRMVLKESTVDSISYVCSIRGLHKELVQIAKQAFDSEIDFYYLRYRLGVSYYYEKNYLLAATHFRKALAFYPADFYTKEYLFFCYLYLNNLSEAKNILAKMPLSSQSYYANMIGKERMLNIESGYQTVSYPSSQNSTTFLGSDGLYAESDRMKSIYYQQVGFNFPLTAKVNLYVGLSYVRNNRNRHIYSNDFYYLYDYQNKVFKKETKLKDTSQDYSLKQYQTYIGTNISLPRRFNLQLGFQNMYYIQEKLGATDDSTKSPLSDTLVYNYRYQINSTNSNNVACSASLSKTVSKWNASMGIGFAHIDKTNIYQVGTQLTYSPFGNYNFNLTAGYYSSFDSTARSIILFKAGGRITNSLWYEAYHYQGNLKNYHESNAYVVYNISDVIKSKTGVNLSYYFHSDWVLNLRYDLLVRAAPYTRYVSGSQNVLTDSYTNNSFIISLLWKY